MRLLLTLFLAFYIFLSNTTGQHTMLFGKVTDRQNNPIADAQIIHELSEKMDFSSKTGDYTIKNLRKGHTRILVIKPGYKIKIDTLVFLDKDIRYDVQLEPYQAQLEEVVVTQSNSQMEALGIQRLQGIEGTSIYESKKTEVLIPNEIALNSATNSARQLYAKVPGVQIWEGDEAGVQLNIGARGLSPSRSSNFNIRQNGYDISADALGYPESYYTPPVEAVERIEIVRGAASLQYGPQFGGLVNFVLRQPPPVPIQFTTRQTVGSFGLLNSFNALGGTYKKLQYLTYVHHKQGDGWRPNSAFDVQNIYASLAWKSAERFSIRLEYTHMQHLAKQPGGLTDAQFLANPRISMRSRNWFEVNWNLAALHLDYQITTRTLWNTRVFANMSRRSSLGNLERIERIDDMQNRTLISDKFQNIGAETRLLHRYRLLGYASAVVVGTRVYRGHTLSVQGDADSSNRPVFTLLHPQYPEVSKYNLTGENAAFFAENVVHLSKRWSVTPGIRAEHIRTSADGFYRETVRDKSGNIVVDNKVDETMHYPRNFVLLGVGSSYRITEDQEVYANATQNYRSVTYSDVRIRNPNFKVDPNIKDERGYNLDLGIRGKLKSNITFDLGVYYLFYRDRIGNILRQDEPPLFIPYRYQTNISDSRAVGSELYTEMEWLKAYVSPKADWRSTLFISISYTDAVYINSENTAISGKYVEYVPPVMGRFGVSIYNKSWLITMQSQYVHTQYADATNAIRSSNAAIGEVPAYMITDVSARYLLKKWTLEAGINNLTNESYFTRRAASYPGPGILPSSPRNLYLTIGLKL